MEKEEEKKERNQSDPATLSRAPGTRSYSLKDKLLMTLIIIAVISLGLLAWNQFIEWRAHALLLKTPCELCRDLNSQVNSCFKEIESGRVNTNIKIYNITLPYS